MNLVRAAAAGIVALGVAVVLGRWTADLTTHGVTRAEDVVALGTAAAGAAVACWYTLTAAGLVLAELARLGRRTPRLALALRITIDRFGAPVLRRAAVVGMGAGLALTAVPAGAGTGDDVPHDLRPGLSSVVEQPTEASAPRPAPTPAPDASPAAPPTPTTAPAASPAPAESRTEQASPPAPGNPAGGAQPPPAAPAAERVPRPAAPSPAGRADTAPDAAAPGTAGSEAASPGTAHVVRAGDSLWSIAAAQLGAGASNAQVAAEWPRWHATNRAVIGADPDLIHPGQALLAPDVKDQP